MKIDIDQQDLKKGLLGLVMALVEIIRDALEHQSVKRVEGGRLNDQQVERLGIALLELNRAIATIKKEHGLDEAVLEVHKTLDSAVSDILGTLVSPGSKEIQERVKEKLAS